MPSVEILQAVPAAGKTKTILNHVYRTKHRTLIASISCQLSQQSFDYYKSLGGADCAIIDTEHVSRSRSVTDAIREARDSYRVIFVTHAAILRYPELTDFTGYELYIDEVPEFVELNEIRFTDNLDIISRYCSIVDGTMSLLPEHRRTVEKMAVDGMYGYDAVSERLFRINRALLQGTPVSVRDNIAYFVDDVTTADWGAFRRITIACANFDGTFTGVVLKKYNDWKIKKSKLYKYLDFHQYRNTARVEIIPMFAGDWSRYAADKERDGVSVYNEVKSTVYDLVGNVPYIYTTNSYRTPLRNGTKVAYNPHGLNSMMSHTVAVALFSYNPMPWQLSMLNRISVDGDLVDAFIVSKYLEPVFQLCLRTDIRNDMSDSKVTLIVPDMRAAEYLKSMYLYDATIDASHMIRPVTVKRKPNGGRKISNRAKETKPRTKRVTFQNILGMSTDEVRKFYKYKVGKGLSAKNEADVETVRTWLWGIRIGEIV